MKKYDGILESSYVMLENRGKFLMIRRYHTGWEDGNFTFPAGHIKKGESAVQTAVREAREEIGVTVQEKDLEFVHVAHRNRTAGNNEYIDFYFKTTKWTGEPKAGVSVDLIEWVDPRKLPKNTIEVVENIVTKIAHGERFSLHGW